MKIGYSFLFYLCCSLLFAQQKQVPKEIIQSIEQHVWIPFMEAYSELDASKLVGLHSKDIVRVFLATNDIQTGEPYLEGFGAFLENTKENGGQVGIAFALKSTAVDASGSFAYQTGYYEFSSKNKDDPDFIVRGYGQFNVGLQKIEGTWKLFLDADERIDLTLEEFENQDMVYRLGN